MEKINVLLKYMIDYLGSIIGIIAISPLLIIIAILIKFTSNGPVFFKQDRLGKNGKTFKIIKYRTMIVNAENIGDGIFIKTGNDNRITKIGKFLRSTSLDELPQLFNVISGDMSLVGPRPPVPHYPHDYSKYTEFQKKRFEMKPGITGLTQVTLRNSVPWSKRIPVDVEYVEKFNIFLDIKILFRTIKTIFIKEKIY